MKDFVAVDAKGDALNKIWTSNHFLHNEIN